MSSTALPARLSALDLTPGRTTRRNIEICSHDADHTIVSDAWAKFDIHRQKHVFDEDLGNPMCNVCDEPLEMMDLDIDNAVAIEDLRRDMLAEIADLERSLARPAPTGAMLSSPPGPASHAWVREVCDECGAEEALIDAYAEFNPLSNTCEIVTTFDKGHSCASCGADGIRPREVRLSNHEVLALLPQIRKRADALKDDLRDLDLWLTQNGETYGLSHERCQDLRIPTQIPQTETA